MIADCLNSLAGIDRITIVDTGSTDNTVEICKRYTKNIFHYIWNDDFSTARNYALSKCTGDWILIIDADEKLITDVNEVKKIVQRAKMDVINCVVRTTTEEIISTRIFRRKKEIYYKAPVHNMLTFNGDEFALLQRAENSNIIFNSGVSPAHWLDPDRSLRILEKNYKLSPNDLRLIYYLGREYLSRDRIDEVIAIYGYYKEMAYGNKWSAELADVLYILALCSSLKQDFIGAVDNAIKAIAVLPSFKAPYLLLAAAYEVQMPDKALLWKKMSEIADDSGVMCVRK